ncbi:MAG: hypothetical protein JXB29_06130 [Sedimentisphaerales bacterium]|nr:hypothetical protein [Sedimentisphaerales bacterium]
MKKEIFVFCWCMCLNSIPLWGADDPPFYEKMGLKKTTIESAIIYYEACFEEKLPVFIKEYKNHKKTIAESRAQKQIPMYKMVSLKNAIIDDINNIVGGNDDLTAFLKKKFDGLIKAFPSIPNTFVGKEKVFYLVLQSTSKDYLRAGGILPNLFYDKETDTAEYKLGFSSESNNPLEQSENLLPFSSVEKFEVEIHEIQRIFSMLLEATSEAPVHLEYIGIHEIAELAIVRQMRSGDPYKRWFTDGFANTITHNVLLRHYSQEGADTFIASYSAEPYKELENQLNLKYWMSAQFALFSFMGKCPLEKENRFNFARYCFATQEAKRLADVYGIEIIKKIIVQYKDLEDKNTDSLYSVIQKVTGEDLRKRFEKYQNFQTRKEGYVHYKKQYEQAIQEKNIKVMIFSMLRMLELCEQPFSRNSLNLRKNIATLFYLTGQKELANQFITEFADFMMLSSDPQNRFVGRHLVVLYALGIHKPEVAYNYARQTFEENPNEIHAMAIVMHQLSKENNMQKAQELAHKICKMEPDDKHSCHQMAKQVLSKTEIK